ncbi:MAG: peptide ABC transporter substrate-binding protein [Candidatus Promineifilaceae bacterium]|nr:peptide ABC transporter substrate-binding protein [Candidatus Promineifilaceae bacterium]
MERYFYLLIVLLVVAGCRGPETDTTLVTRVVNMDDEEMMVTRVVNRIVETPTRREAAQDETAAVLDVALEGGPGVFDPQQAGTSNELDLVENLFVGLTRFNHATNSVEPELASSWEVSADGQTWTFHLREDVFWIDPGLRAPDGLMSRAPGPHPYRPVLADDVVFAIERACDAQTQTPDIVVLFIIEGCEARHRQTQAGEEPSAPLAVRAPDEQTVEITLTEPASYFPVIATMSLLRPVPREIVEAFSDAEVSWAEMENVVTSGPFVPDGATTAGERMVLERNPFWPIEFSGTVQHVNVYWQNAAEAYERWLNRELDVVPMPAGMRETIMNDTRLRSRLHLVTNQAVFYLSYNFDSEVFSEAAVRRAFSAAIDREALVEDVYGGEGLPMRHFTPPGVLGAPPPDQVGTGYNGDLARLEMASSSFSDCTFIPEIRYLVNATDVALHHAETVRTMWQRELGCPEEKIVIEQVPFGVLLANTRPDAGADRPDIWDLGWNSYFPDAHNWLGDVLHCTQSENRQRRPCSDADRLIAEAATQSSTEERGSLYREAERLFFGESGIEPVTPLFVQGQYVLIQPWLVYQPAQFGGEQYDTYQLDQTVKRLERER